MEIKFQTSIDGKCLITIWDNTLIKNMDELNIRYGCAYGWGKMLTLAKAYIEKGIILLNNPE